jgi:hypothetical protein
MQPAFSVAMVEVLIVAMSKLSEHLNVEMKEEPEEIKDVFEERKYMFLGWCQITFVRFLDCFQEF